MRISPAVLCIVVVAAASNARADCAAAPGYSANISTSAAGTVSIGTGEPGDQCGGSVPMLRQNIDTGEVVQLAEYCDGDRYLDECVPTGRYRYGLATPLPCEGCGGVPYFTVVTVMAGAGACMRSTGDPGPTPYSQPVPWNKSPVGAAAMNTVDNVCVSGGCNAGGRIYVHVLDLLALAGAIAWSALRRRRQRCLAG